MTKIALGRKSLCLQRDNNSKELDHRWLPRTHIKSFMTSNWHSIEIKIVNKIDHWKILIEAPHFLANQLSENHAKLNRSKNKER